MPAFASSAQAFNQAMPAARLASIPDGTDDMEVALPSWFTSRSSAVNSIHATVPRADEPDTYTDDAGRYRFEELPWGTHKITLDPSTLPPDLRPAEEELVPVLWLNPGQEQTSNALSTGVRFTAAYDRKSGILGGLVFLDRDGDGQLSAGEHGLSNVRVIDPTVHQYFVPFDDRNLWTLFVEKDQCHGPTPSFPLVSYIFVTAESDGTVYYYDHWEDGYDPDPLNPGSTTEAGGLDAGVTQLFQSNIDPTSLPWPPLSPPYYYDGRDRVTILGESCSVVRLAYPTVPDVILASAWEVPEAASWGRQYIATVGEDLDFNGPGLVDDHDYAGLSVMAWQDSTDVYYNGTYARTLNAGQTYFISGANDGAGGGGVDSTDMITATYPVQVHMMTGSCDGLGVSAHGYNLQPEDVWGTAYWAPVPGFAEDCNPTPGEDNADTDIYLHNPHPYPIDVTVANDLVQASVTIPATTTISVLDATGWADLTIANFGTSLTSSDMFWGMVVVDSSTNGSTDAQVYDWGYSLVPELRLSSQVVVGYAPGNNLDPPTNNGNIAFVTAITDTVIYVDLDQDGLSDPFDMDGDGFATTEDVFGIPEWDEPLSALGIPLGAGQALRVGDPFDRRMRGAIIYTLNLEDRIAVAWGQDPCRSLGGSPYLDLGYTILPTPIPQLSKVDELAIDADLTGDVSPGDTITYTLVLYNNGLGSMNNTVLTDPLPYTYTHFVPSSLHISTPPPVGPVEYYDGASWGTTPITDAQMIRIHWDTIGPHQMVTIAFRVRLLDTIPLTVTEISNQAVVRSDDTPPRLSEDPDDPFDPDTDTPVGRPFLALEKSVTPATVRPGDHVTYTVVVTNTGTGCALNLVLTDALPAEMTYRPGTLNVTWPIARVVTTTRTITRTSSFHGNYVDDFDLTSTEPTYYAGNDGSLAWSTTWSEVDDDGNYDSGEVQIGTAVLNALSDPAYIEITDNDEDDAGLQRTADLSQFRAPSLRYYVFGTTSGVSGDDEYSIVVNGTPLATETYNDGWTLRELDLSAYAGTAAVTIEFLALENMESSDLYRFDNISIYETEPSRVLTETRIWEEKVLTYRTSTGGDPVSYDPISGRMVITEGMRFPGGGVLTATFQAQVSIPLTNGLQLTNTTCLNASNHADTPCDDAAVEVQSSHALTITKVGEPSPVPVGGLLTYTLAYVAAGDAPAPNVIITDSIPAGTTFFAATGGIRVETPPVGGTGIVTWHLGTLLTATSGITYQTGVVRLVVWVDLGLTADSITNTARIVDDTGTSDEDDESTDLGPPEPDLTVMKWGTPTLVANGQRITYTLVAINSGGVLLNPVTLTDTLPPELQYADQATPAEPDVIDGQTQVWSDITGGAGLAPRARLTITFQAIADVGSGATGTYTNRVTGSGDHPGGRVTDRDEFEVTAQDPAVAVDKNLVGQDNDVLAPNYVTFTIAVANVGPSTIDVLPLQDQYDVNYLSFTWAEPMPDEPEDDGLLTWYDLTVAGAHGFGRNLPPGEAFAITAVFRIVTDTVSTINTAIVDNAVDIYNNPADRAEDDAPVENVPTFVELLYFRAQPLPDAVLLEWETAVEIDNYGFFLLRSASGDPSDAVEIAFLPAAGRGQGGGATYRFTDVTVQAGVNYTYWLVDVDINGKRTLQGAVTATALSGSDTPYHSYLPFIPR